MSDDQGSPLPKDLQGTANLLAHPMAGAAALSAIGLGIASQSIGMWMGFMAGAAETAQRMLTPPAGPEPGVEPDAAPKPARRAEARVKLMVDNVRQAAQEAAETAAGLAGTAAAAIASVPAIAENLAELMPEDFRQPKAMEKPSAPDDLKAISGIGPKLETVLNGLGIWTFGQVAALAREEAAWLDDYLGFKGRITRDDWTGQAAKLAGGTKH